MVADPLHENWYWTTRPVSETTFKRGMHHQIFPGHRPEADWSLDELLVFLNELDDQWKISDSSRVYRSAKPDDRDYTRFTIKRLLQPGETDPGAIWVIAPVDSTKHHFEVHVDRAWLTPENGWQTSETEIFHYRYPNNRVRTPAKRELLRTFFYPQPIRRNASKSLKRGDLLGIVEKNDVSAPFAYFVSKMKESEKMSPHRRLYLDHLWSAVVPTREPTPAPLNYHSFEIYGGFLNLILEPRRLGAKHLLEPWSLGTELQPYSIVAGLFIHSHATSILVNRDANAIAGLMMDTTWSVMRQYVTSILVGVSHNTAVPLAFAFGPAETTELYEQFYTGFAQRGVDISTFIIESDQGPALKSFCANHGITQRFCLHHFLRTLKDPLFSVYVGDIVRARAPEELDTLMRRYSGALADLFRARHAEREDLLKRARKLFKKAGLGVTDALEILVQDEARWQQVSMLTRVHEDMPPTTNALESIHGHFNESTPRNNTFWASMCRLGAQMVRSLKGYGVAVRHNFARASRKTRDMLWVLKRSQQERTLQLQFYQPIPGHCPCGQTVHLSSMYGIDIPCAHRLFLGEDRAKMFDAPVLVMEAEIDHLDVTSVVHRVPVPDDGDERREYLMDMAMNNIRRSSHTRKSKKDVMAWVVANYPQEIGTEFALGLPMTVLELILAGVALFAIS
jgi:hypothetical protein